jgi:hypothetical protein
MMTKPPRPRLIIRIVNTTHMILELSCTRLPASVIATKRHGVARGEGDSPATPHVRRRGKGVGKAYFGGSDVIAAEEEVLVVGIIEGIG